MVPMIDWSIFHKKIVFSRTIATITTASSLLLIGGGLFGLNFAVASKLNRISELTKAGNYEEAIFSIEVLQKNWMVKDLRIKQKVVGNALTLNQQLLKDKVSYELGIEAVNNKSWDEARLLLGNISQIFPKHGEAKNKLEEVEDKLIQERIESAVREVTAGTQAQLESAKISAEEARKRIEEEAAQRVAEFKQEVAQSSYNPSDIIAKWKPLVARITCSGSSDSWGGSGTLLKLEDDSLFVITNRHVITYKNDYAPDVCFVSFPGLDPNLPPVSADKIKVSNEFDLGFLYIDNTLHRTTRSAQEKVNVFNPIYNFCKNVPKEGDEVIILGYPRIGSSENLTATRGIISSKEGDFYVTDAKISDGNSGGAAIILKNNCYLGIPTGIKSSGYSLETLGYILDAGTAISETKQYAKSSAFFSDSAYSSTPSQGHTTNTSQPPVVNISFSPIDPTKNPILYKTSEAGQTLTIYWEAIGAESCYGSKGWSGDLPTYGSKLVSPDTTETYRIDCTNAYGTLGNEATVQISPYQ